MKHQVYLLHKTGSSLLEEPQRDWDYRLGKEGKPAVLSSSTDPYATECFPSTVCVSKSHILSVKAKTSEIGS